MSYIWENYWEEQHFCLVDGDISPYLECCSQDTLVSVNVHLRLSELFFPREFCNSSENAESLLLAKYREDKFFKELLNLFLHYQVTLDFFRGLTVYDLLCYWQKEKIFQGNYGHFPLEQFPKLTAKEQKIFLTQLVHQHLSRQRGELLGTVLMKLFPKIEIYQEMQTDTVHIFIHVLKSESNLRKYDLAVYFFKNIRQEVAVRWQGEHLAFIEVYPSIRIEEFGIG